MEKQTQSIDDAVLFRDYMSPIQHLNYNFETIPKGPPLPASDDLSRVQRAFKVLNYLTASVENTEQANLQKLYKQASFPSNHT